MEKSFALLCVWMLIITSLTGCTAQPNKPTEKKTVVTTFFPYYVFTKNLAGELFNVELLISNQAEPHDYQFKPSDLALLNQADLVIKNGLGLDDWIDEAIQSSGSKAKVFNASTGLNLLAPQSEARFVTESEEGHTDSPFDPHVWVSPQNVLKMLPNITTELTNLAPEQKDTLNTLLSNYSQKITDLDLNIKTLLAPINNKQFVSFHSVTQYFARDYGIKNAASLQAYPGEEPTPYYLKQLHDYIVANNIKVIATEPQFSPQIVQTLAADWQLKVISFDPMETGNYTLTAYQDIMQSNVAQLAQALSPTS